MGQWILERIIFLPFVPFKNLVIQEPVGKDKSGKRVFFPWRILEHHVIQYVNDWHDGYFLVDEKQDTSDGEQLIKMYESQGWGVVETPQPQEAASPKEAVVVKNP